MMFLSWMFLFLSIPLPCTPSKNKHILKKLLDLKKYVDLMLHDFCTIKQTQRKRSISIAFDNIFCYLINDALKKHEGNLNKQRKVNDCYSK